MNALYTQILHNKLLLKKYCPPDTHLADQYPIAVKKYFLDCLIQGREPSVHIATKGWLLSSLLVR